MRVPAFFAGAWPRLARERLEVARPEVAYPDLLGPLELARGDDPRFAGALRMLRKALNGAERAPYPDAENAIKDANAAVEAAARELTGTAGDLEAQVRTLAKRGLIHKRIERTADALFRLRSDEAGVAHGGASVPSVGVPEAMLAIQVAAGLLTYFADRVPAPRRSHGHGKGRLGSA